ncbi:MAG: alkaline phosphatase family protein, partial [Planctomycetota bacterium]
MTRATLKANRAAHRGRPLLFFALVLLAAAIAAALLFGLRGRPRPSVLLITIDTLRADALIEQDTPALLELKARGTAFARARTPVPLTLPAHATLLSGLSPKHHRLRDNTARPLPSRARRGFPLLAEEFVEAGYATAAFV